MSIQEYDEELRSERSYVAGRLMHVADNGLCFGRLDTLSGEHSYIGRIGIFDGERLPATVARLAGVICLDHPGCW